MRQELGQIQVLGLCPMQKSILAQADIMLKLGGRLVYSTCTFSLRKDEMVISNFLDEHKDYELHDIPKVNGTEPGRLNGVTANTK